MWWPMPLIPALRGKDRRIPVSSKAAWPREWVSGHAGLHSETLKEKKSRVILIYPKSQKFSLAFRLPKSRWQGREIWFAGSSLPTQSGRANIGDARSKGYSGKYKNACSWVLMETVGPLRWPTGKSTRHSPDSLSSTPGTHTTQKENWQPSAKHPPRGCAHSCMHTH